MKDLFRKPEHLRSAEFWIATAILVFAVFFLISRTISLNTDISEPVFGRGYFRFHFMPLLLRFFCLYGAFILLNNLVIPKLAAQQRRGAYLLLGGAVVVLLGIALGTTDTYLKSEVLARFDTIDDAWVHLFRRSLLYACWLTLVLAFYTLLKYAALRVLNAVQERGPHYPFRTPEAITAFLLWAMSLFFLVTLVEDRDVLAGWTVFFLSAIVFYGWATYVLIPAMRKKRRSFLKYGIRSALLWALAILPMAAVVISICRDAETSMGLALFTAVFHVLVTTPAFWLLYKRRMKGQEEMFVLREELGRSHASLDFLRSQINPHFLFNALNTIYGTAIQEGAARTGEGIERLGDMMRFMLQENIQEKILLSREIEYLHNYIALQKLRTDPSPGVSIVTAIPEDIFTETIAPMLLIPFVENAFKHGISLREPSFIKISLEVNGSTLEFDVQNSRHARYDADPEKNRSGIGLNNVKQRLRLLYKDRHTLIIRETSREFFVHLTVQLS